MADDTATQKKEHRWTVDTHIPIFLVAALVVQTVGFVWAGATYKANFEARMAAVEELAKLTPADERRITILETRGESLTSTLAQIQESLNAVNNKIDAFLVRDATPRTP